MKKMMTLAMMMVMTVSANAMSYNEARNEALFLSDKMAHELNLTDHQYNAVYKINMDYFMSVNRRDDVLGMLWDRRNADLQMVLTAYQYNKYVRRSYFYRPVSWNAGSWIFHVYSYYRNHSKFYKPRPTIYASYKGRNHQNPATRHIDQKPVPSAKGQGAIWGRASNRNATTVTAKANNGRVPGATNHQATSNNRSNSYGRFGGNR